MSNEHEFVNFISQDGVSFKVTLSVATMSGLANTMIEGDNDTEVPKIPLPNVKATVLQKVIEFCEHYSTEPMTKIGKPLKSAEMWDLVQTWYADFVNIDQSVLFELIHAANYMGIEDLVDLTCAKVACKIKGKSTEEICSTFSITEKLTSAEEAQIREENPWNEGA